MIIVDSSALLAIYFDEPEKSSFAQIVGSAAAWQLDRIIGNLGLDVVAFEAAHVQAAREAFRKYGKGRHRASLNFGDCCAYALAKLRDVPLLFKGNDFALTDLKRAL